MEGIESTLIGQIRVAFGGVQRGYGISLHEAVAMDDFECWESRADARARDLDTSWEDVPALDIEKNDCIFSYLDKDGFLYYLPAYMVWYLRNYRTSLSSSGDFLIYTLDPTGIRMETKLTYFAALTHAQKDAVFEFLQFMARLDQVDADAATRALDNYWREAVKGHGS